MSLARITGNLRRSVVASGRNDSGGCGCLILILLAFAVGGGFWQGIGLLAAGWFGYLVFIGVCLGIVLAIIRAIADD